MILSVGNGSLYVDQRDTGIEEKSVLAEESVTTPTVFASTQPFQSRISSLSIPSANPQTPVLVNPTEMVESKPVHQLPVFNRSCSFRNVANSSIIHIRKFMGDEEKQYFHGIDERVSLISSSLPHAERIFFLHFSVRDNVIAFP